jgi:UDP-3-O-[3-hydroxymyristoyl] glucosamine N-acyltransferase
MAKFLLKDLAHKLGAQIIGDGECVISGVGGLEEAACSDISFLANPKYHENMIRSKASAICIGPNEKLLPSKNFLICENPSKAFQDLIELFIPPLSQSQFSHGIHSTAVVDPSAIIEEGAHIGPYCVIGAKVLIKKGTRLIAHVYIGEESVIGENSLIHPHVTVRERSILGQRVTIQPGAVIGSCGFGYVTMGGSHHKLQQLGFVILEDDVEVGANTTIDRARFHNTKISMGSKIDNLVQIGHNVEIGKHNLIVSQVGIAGSSKTGDYVVLGGQVGVVGHVEIASQTLVGAKAGISKNITKAGKYTGVPLQPIDDYNRQQVLIRKLPELFAKIKKLEEKLLKS